MMPVMVASVVPSAWRSVLAAAVSKLTSSRWISAALARHTRRTVPGMLGLGVGWTAPLPGARTAVHAASAHAAMVPAKPPTRPPMARLIAGLGAVTSSTWHVGISLENSRGLPESSPTATELGIELDCDDQLTMVAT